MTQIQQYNYYHSHSLQYTMFIELQIKTIIVVLQEFVEKSSSPYCVDGFSKIYEAGINLFSFVFICVNNGFQNKEVVCWSALFFKANLFCTMLSAQHRRKHEISEHLKNISRFFGPNKFGRSFISQDSHMISSS